MNLLVVVSGVSLALGGLCVAKASTAANKDVVRNVSGGKITGEVPPGMIEIPAGRAIVGISKERAVAIISEFEEKLLVQDFFAGCVPEHEVDVPTFFMDMHEVTNRQYGLYVDAESRFWQPRVDGNFPICAVTPNDASACASWMGRRLPTEVEWSRAARGDLKENVFVWGTHWNERASSSGATQSRLTAKVMSYKEDVSWCGVYDLMGNVTELTSSPYVAHPGYEDIVLTSGRDKQLLNPPFSQKSLVMKGGSAEGSELSNNGFFRQPIHEYGRFSLVGFRTAKSSTPGYDQLRYEIRKGFFMIAEALDPDNELNWSDLGAQEIFRSADEDGITMTTSADALAFGHVGKVNVSKRLLETNSVEEPQFVAVVHTTQPVAEPSLSPGTYAVFFKTKGTPMSTKGETNKDGAADEDKRRQQKGKWFQDDLVYPNDKDVFLFRSISGAAVGHVEVSEVAEVVLGPCEFSYKLGNDDMDYANYRFVIEGANTGRAFQWQLTLGFIPGTFHAFP